MSTMLTEIDEATIRELPGIKARVAQRTLEVSAYWVVVGTMPRLIALAEALLEIMREVAGKHRRCQEIGELCQCADGITAALEGAREARRGYN